jgi:hypothetical protein
VSAFSLPFIVGNKLYEDHQHWPVMTRDDLKAIVTTDGTYTPAQRVDQFWPVALTLDQMIALAWRVKRWKLTGSYSAAVTGFTYPHGDASGGAVTVTLDDPMPDEIVASVDSTGTVVYPVIEPMLVSAPIFSPTYYTPAGKKYAGDLPYSFLANLGLGSFMSAFNLVDLFFQCRHTQTISDTYYLTPTPRTGTVIPPQTATNVLTNSGVTIFRRGHDWESFYTDMVFRGSRGFDVVIYDPATKLFSPYISAGFTASHFFGVPSDEGDMVAAFCRNCPVTKTPNGTLTIDPVVAGSFDISLFTSGSYGHSDIFSESDSSTGSASFNLVAVEFFPYQNSLGQPVYDTATGAQIHDPFA